MADGTNVRRCAAPVLRDLFGALLAPLVIRLAVAGTAFALLFRLALLWRGIAT